MNRMPMLIVMMLIAPLAPAQERVGVNRAAAGVAPSAAVVAKPGTGSRALSTAR